MKIIVPLAKTSALSIIKSSKYKGIDFRVDKLLKTRAWLRNVKTYENIFFIIKDGYLERLVCNIFLKRWFKNSQVIYITKDCAGAAMTVLSALPQILDNTDEDFIVDFSDIYFTWSGEISAIKSTSSGVFTFNSQKEYYSYFATRGDTNIIIKAAEKNRISMHASVGVYYFRNFSAYAKGIDYSLKEIDECTYKNDFYVSQLYNGLSKSGEEALILQVHNVTDKKQS